MIRDVVFNIAFVLERKQYIHGQLHIVGCAYQGIRIVIKTTARHIEVIILPSSELENGETYLGEHDH